MNDRTAYIQDLLATLHANIRLYEIAPNIHTRDLAAEKIVQGVRSLDEAGAIGDPDAPVPFRLTSAGREA